MKKTQTGMGLAKHRKSGKSRSANPQKIAREVNKLNESKKKKNTTDWKDSIQELIKE